MATRARNSKWTHTLGHVAKARELALKYELDKANPVGDFVPNETIESEFDRLLKKLS